MCVLRGGGAGGLKGEMLRPICLLNLQNITPCGQIKVLCPEICPKRGLSSARSGNLAGPQMRISAKEIA